MNISTPDILPTPDPVARSQNLVAAAAAPTTRPAASFAKTLANQTALNDPAAEKAARRQAEEAAAGLVSMALILPILKQVRRSVFAENTPFSPGIGEKAFGPQFDMQLADRIAHSPRLGIKDALADRLMKRGVPQKPATPAMDSLKAPKLDLHG